MAFGFQNLQARNIGLTFDDISWMNIIIPTAAIFINPIVGENKLIK